MFGLVITSASSGLRQIIRRFWFGFGAPAPVAIRMPEPLTLEQELEAMEIRTFFLDKVRAFQKEHLRLERRANRAGKQAMWRRYSVFEYQLMTENSSSLSFLLGGAIPEDVQQTIRKAKTIPNSRVFVEFFDNDPFLFIERSKPSREEACVGYWNAPGFKPEQSDPEVV